MPTVPEVPPAAPPPSSPRHHAERGTGWRTVDVLRTTALVVGVLLALALLWVAREIFLTAFLGVLFGLAVGAGAERLARLRVPRGLGAAVVVFGCLGALYGVGAWIAPTLGAQGALLRTRVPEAVDRLEAWVNARPGLAGLVLGGQPVASGAVSPAASPAAPAAAPTPPPAPGPVG